MINLNLFRELSEYCTCIVQCSLVPLSGEMHQACLHVDQNDHHISFPYFFSSQNDHH